MLDRQELELEKRLEKSNLKAIKENDNSKLIDKKTLKTKNKIAKMKKPPQQDTYIDAKKPESVVNMDRRDLALQAQLEKMSYNANADELADYEPKKIISSITQEMIDEYQAERQAPLRVGDTDFKYFPASGLAGFVKELPDPSKIKPILSDVEIKQLNDEINASISEISRLNDLIQEIQNDVLPRLANDFDI